LYVLPRQLEVASSVKRGGAAPAEPLARRVKKTARRTRIRFRDLAWTSRRRKDEAFYQVSRCATRPARAENLPPAGLEPAGLDGPRVNQDHIPVDEDVVELHV
jgi:hypothetical protein